MMKFIAADLDAAKAKARRALGEKAVVVAVRDLPSGDVEVTASDKPQPNAPAIRIEPTFGDRARRDIDDKTSGRGGARLNERIEQRFAEDALSRLRGDLSGGKRGAQRLDLSDAAARGLNDTLAPHGLGEKLIGALIDGARASRIDEDYYRLETAFAEVFSFQPFAFSPGAPIMLVGPTGAGKTSSAAKLAAEAMASGPRALIMTADVGRAGAVDQLRTYADSLGADYFLVDSPHDVAEALRQTRPEGGVILDTPGVSPYDAGDIAAMRSYREAANAEPVLVLPASGDAEEFKEWALAFREIGVRRAIVTKFDATKRVGAALAAVHAGGMALAHFSETAFISEGLLPASPDYLARRLLASRPGRLG